MKYIASIIIGIMATYFLVYGFYWIGKTVSYKIFYEDMVQQTIVEMVDTKALR